MSSHGRFAAAGFDIADVYAKYCDIIVSGRDHASTKELLGMLAESIESRRRIRDTTFGDILKLMSFLDLDDSRQFSTFYDFVFFICRENAQKNISIQRAVAAWRIVLNGRFRLLDQWCIFVERHQRYNISEDTWQQLLAFSRCVNEDLEGYDPKGAWPVLIDDFVEHMYRIYHSNEYRTKDSMCSCDEMGSQCSISNTFSGLNLLPGSKRKCPADVDSNEGDLDLSGNSTRSVHLVPLKRLKESCVNIKFGVWGPNVGTPSLGGSADYDEDMNIRNSRGCLQKSPCVVEDSLSKGFEGYLSIGCCFQYNQKSAASFI